jgi:N-acetylneuraminate synthase
VKEEAPTIAFAFASVVSIKNILPGQILDESNIWVKRPGGGDFSALDFEKLLGVKALVEIKSGIQIKRGDIEYQALPSEK